MGAVPLNSSSSGPALLPRPRHISLSGKRVEDRVPMESLRPSPSLPAQGYRLVVGPDAITIDAADAAGLRYGRLTLEQLRHRANAPDGSLYECEITDWPDHLVRGVMIDISRDKVPTTDTLELIVEELVSWKFNHLELYMEHTFAYVGHDEVWARADPVTAAELAHLDKFCAERGIDLVPNQNTLGHFERWLRHDRYRSLAITPDGFEWLFGIRRGPTTIDPRNPGSFQLANDLLDQLVSALDKPTIHIGLDEPWELSGERAGEWPGWLSRLAQTSAIRDRNMLVWGDVPANHPEMLESLAQLAGDQNSISVCEWGYEADHPFDERLGRLGDAGLDFWVCPGTSTWMSITGRAVNMFGNIKSAALAGDDHGATGFLVTDWGDFGHLQYQPFSAPGFATAGAFSWCASAHEDLSLEDLARLLDVFYFDDPEHKLGDAMISLASINELLTPKPPNMSALIGNILFPQLPVGKLLSTGITEAELDLVEQTMVDALVKVSQSQSARPDAQLIADEMTAATRWLGLASRDARARLRGDGYIRSIAEEERKALSRASDDLDAEHRRLWLARNREGGLQDSLAWLTHLSGCYETGEADRQWFGPLMTGSQQ